LFAGDFPAKALYYISYGNASQTWPTCTGTVTKTEIIRRSGSGGSDGNSIETFLPKITYSYTISGRQCTRNRYAFGEQSFSNCSVAQKIVDKYPVNSEVAVYYSPNRPGTSVLLPGIQPLPKYFCIFGAAFSAIPLVVLLLIRR